MSSTSRRAIASDCLAVLVVGVSSALVKNYILTVTDGGTDIRWAFIPKMLLFLSGQNPYLTDQWAAPYPPFYFVLWSMVLLGFLMGADVSSASPEALALSSRYVALAFDLATGLVIYATVRRATGQKVPSLALYSLYSFLPTFTIEQEAWFGDSSIAIFILAVSLLCFQLGRDSLGLALLGATTIFKPHTFLASIFIIVWLYRRKINRVRNICLLGAIISGGLIAPSLIPGYLSSVIGFNSSYLNLYSFGLLTALYSIALVFFGVKLEMAVYNAIWILTTLAMVSLVLPKIIKDSSRFQPVDVICMGLLTWFIPMRTFHPSYLLWWMVSFADRGKIVPAFLIAVIVEVGRWISSYAWIGFAGWGPPSPIPLPAAVPAIATAALAYTIAALIALLDIASSRPIQRWLGV